MLLGMLSLFWPFYVSKVLNVDKLLHQELCCLSSPSESEITCTVVCVEYCYNQIPSLSIFISFFNECFIFKVKIVATHNLSLISGFVSSVSKLSFLTVVLCKIKDSFKARKLILLEWWL